MKIATNATIHQTSKIGNHGNVEASVDSTGFGVPLKVGPTVEGARETSDATETVIAEPFILAYELKRVRMRRDCSRRKTDSYTKHALFDDRVAVDQDLEELGEMWEVEDVGVETEHDA